MKISSIIVAAAFISSPSLAQNYPTYAGQPVIDSANVIPADREAILNQRIIQFTKETGGEMALVTVPSLEGYDIETYSNNYFRELGIGNKQVNNGVMLLVAPNDRKVRIEIGYGLEPIFTDADASMIIQNIILPPFRDGNMIGGIEAGTLAVIEGATPLTAEQIALAKEADAKLAAATALMWARVMDFFIGVLIFAASILGLAGLYRLATLPLRRRKAAAEKERLRVEKEERDARIAANEEEARRLRVIAEAKRVEQRRLDALEERRARKVRADREKAAAEARTKMLEEMSPKDRTAFLNNERLEKERIEQQRREAEAKAAILRENTRRAEEAAAAAALVARNKRRREEEEEAAERRRRDSSSSSSSSSYSSSSSDSFGGFGGGSSGGGGASGSW